jgi:hypothetical protein
MPPFGPQAGCRIPEASLRRPLNPDGTVVARIVLGTPGQVLAGYDLSQTYVDAKANDCTIRDCLLGTAGYYTVRQYAGIRGLTVEWSTFDGKQTGTGAGTSVWGGDGVLAVRNCDLRGLPSDAIKLSAGTVEECRIASIGWGVKAHGDAIVIASTTGPVVLRRNWIDLTPDGAPAGGNNALRVNAADGTNVSGVQAINNVMIGGTNTVHIDRLVQNARVAGNWIAYGPSVGPTCFGYLYPDSRPADLIWEGNSEWGTGKALPL